MATFPAREIQLLASLISLERHVGSRPSLRSPPRAAEIASTTTHKSGPGSFPTWIDIRRAVGMEEQWRNPNPRYPTAT
jgi:hypothetical protein